MVPQVLGRQAERLARPVGAALAEPHAGAVEVDEQACGVGGMCIEDVGGQERAGDDDRQKRRELAGAPATCWLNQQAILPFAKCTVICSAPLVGLVS